MKIIVDRIEDNIATVELENGKTVNIPAVILGNAQDGDVIKLTIEKANRESVTDTHSFFEKLRNKT